LKKEERFPYSSSREGAFLFYLGLTRMGGYGMGIKSGEKQW